MRLPRFLRRRDRGASALEFVLVMPLLAMLMFAAADYGNAMQQAIRLEAAARAGAQVAFTSPRSVNAINTAVRSALAGWAEGTNCGNGSGATENGYCLSTQSWCQCSSSAVAPGSGVDCDEPPTGCTLQQYVSISVRRPYQPVIVVPVTMLRGNVELRLL
jgi:Flp pilus assembly protein TadG